VIPNERFGHFRRLISNSAWLITVSLNHGSQLCDDYHADSCRPERNRISNSLDVNLINITTRAIISTKANIRYISLSYVWGTGYGGEKAQSTAVFSNISSGLLPKFLPPRVSQTVEDAISVVKELGEQFLWVDAYCIYVDRSQIKDCGNLRFEPPFSEGFRFATSSGRINIFPFTLHFACTSL